MNTRYERNEKKTEYLKLTKRKQINKKTLQTEKGNIKQIQWKGVLKMKMIRRFKYFF